MCVLLLSMMVYEHTRFNILYARVILRRKCVKPSLVVTLIYNIVVQIFKPLCAVCIATL